MRAFNSNSGGVWAWALLRVSGRVCVVWRRTGRSVSVWIMEDFLVRAVKHASVLYLWLACMCRFKFDMTRELWIVYVCTPGVE